MRELRVEVYNNLKRFPAFLDSEGKKVPIFDDWKTLATNDPVQLDNWYRKYGGPRFLWGIPCGEDNGIFALDIDVKPNENINGWETINGGQLHLPNTVAQQTMSGGSHIIFKYPKGSGLGNRVKFLAGLDTRGEGGWIVDYGFTQSNVPLAEVPEWLFHAAKKKEITLLENGTNYTIDPKLLRQKIDTIIQTIINAPSGEGNAVLNAQAFEMGRLVTTGGLTLEEAEKILVDAATTNNRRGLYEAQATSRSGLEGGMKNPLLCPFDAAPKLLIPVIEIPEPEKPEDWLPRKITLADLVDVSKLKQPVLFKDWSSQDIELFNATGGTSKTTLMLYEAICMRLGDRFLGFECMRPNGKTLIITGEDRDTKLMATLGAIIKQMGIIDDTAKVQHILDGIWIKKDNKMCIVSREKDGTFTANQSALNKVGKAIETLRPDKVIFDPLALFWGPESQLNDMSRGVIDFATEIVDRWKVAISFIHHGSADGHNKKDLGQMFGRGGSILPSHSRIIKAMRKLMADELDEFIDRDLSPTETAILCNISKYTDYSEHLDKPFLIIRDGYLFKRESIKPKVQQKEQYSGPLAEKEVLDWVIAERKAGRYPTRRVIEMQFKPQFKFEVIKSTIEALTYMGYGGTKLSVVPNPHSPDSKSKVYVVIDDKGNEVN